ncbi:DsbA family protein [Nostocoides australiense]
MAVTPPPPQDRSPAGRGAELRPPAGASRGAVAAIVALVTVVAVAAGVIWSQRSGQDQAGPGASVPASGTASRTEEPVPTASAAEATAPTPGNTTSTASASATATGPQSTPEGAGVDEGYRSFAGVDLRPGAPVVTVFEDFQCPACAQLEGAIGATLNELAADGKIQLNYRIMNFLDEMTGGTQSTPVANGAFCAADQGKWQEFHDAAFAEQYPEGTSVSVEQIAAFARTAQVPDLDAWTACTESAPYSTFVADSNAAATTDGVTGTPTVWIDGKPVALRDIITPAGLRAAIVDATE